MNNQTQFVYDMVIKNPKINSILNIGYRLDSDPTIMNYAKEAKKKWYVLEIYRPNADELIKNRISTYCMDVMDIDKIDKTFDAIVWLHGPEHITWEQFLEVRNKIEEKSKYLTIYQAPIGIYPQGELYNNPFERHITTLYPEMFADLGCKTESYEEYGEKTFSAWALKNI